MPVYVPYTPKSKGSAHSMCPFMTPPPYGYWEKPIGMGVKKKKISKREGKGLLSGKNSPFNSIPILGQIFLTHRCPRLIC